MSGQEHTFTARTDSTRPGRRRGAWVARLLIPALAATAIITVPPFTPPGAEAAPTSSSVLELADLVPDEALDRVEGTAQALGDAADDDDASPDEASDGWVESEPFDPGSIVMVGVEIDGDEQPMAHLRVENDGEWERWSDLPYPDPDDGPDPGTDEHAAGGNVTEPVWIGEVDRLQVRVEGGTVDVGDVSLHAVNIDGGLDFDPAATGPGAAHASDPLGIIKRSSWDPNNDCKPRSGPSYASNAHFTVIHHTAGSNNYSRSEAASQLRAICLFHRNANGWNDLGYNIVVDRYGRTYEGRAGGLDRAVVGAHAAGYNSGSFGVSVMGCFDSSCSPSLGSTALPSAALAAVDEVVAWKFALHGIDPNGRHTHSNGHRIDTIVGHRDVGSTSCPGNRFTPYVRGSHPMKDRVAPLMDEFEPWGESQEGRFAGGSRDGLTTYSPATGQMLVAKSQGDGFDVDEWTRFRTRDDWSSHVVGDFTGNDHEDVASFHRGTGRWWVSRSTGSDSFSPQHWETFKARTGWQEHLVGDFTGDGHDDIASFHDNGTWWVSSSDGSEFTTRKWAEFNTASGWQSHLVGDFTGDDRDDVLNYHPRTGRWYLLGSQGNRFSLQLYGSFRTTNGWDTHLVGDFTGNDRADVASYHPSNGTWWVSRSTDGGLRTALWDQFRTRTGWQTHLAGDVTGNGHDDLVSYHPGAGSMWVSRSDGSTFNGQRWARFNTRSGWATHVLLDATGNDRMDVASFHPSNHSLWVSTSTGSSFSVSRWD